MIAQILRFLKHTATKPQIGGTVHLACIAAVVLLTVLLIWRLRNADEKTYRRLMLAVWLLMVVAEIYKQIINTYTVSPEGLILAEYQWYAFPFQFCSSPIYVLPFVIFLPEGKVRDCFIAFLATFSLFAGLAVYAFPGDVFAATVGLNVQTMMHHGLQIVIGAYAAVRYYKKLNFQYFLGGVGVFVCLVAVALTLNVGVHAYMVGHVAPHHQFNMFYLSPYYGCSMPVLSLIRPAVPYPVFLVIYVLGFTMIGLLVFGIEVGLTKLFRGKRRTA